VRDSGKYTHLEISITEGRNRQVRRMIEAVESKVLKLVRTAIGPVTFGDLKIGKCREMMADEVAALSGSPIRKRTSNPAPNPRTPQKKRFPRSRAARR
jgi:16S rRNA U516 pseudouridylate synthase RsuA-like enzyme